MRLYQRSILFIFILIGLFVCGISFVWALPVMVDPKYLLIFICIYAPVVFYLTKKLIFIPKTCHNCGRSLTPRFGYQHVIKPEDKWVWFELYGFRLFRVDGAVYPFTVRCPYCYEPV